MRFHRPLLLFLTCALFMNCVAAGACLNNAAPAVAPTKLDDNVRWFWDNADALDDTELSAGGDTLQTDCKSVTWDAPPDGGTVEEWKKAFEGVSPDKLALSDLTAAGLTTTEDPDAGRSLMAVNMFNCTLGNLTKILASADQFNEYPGSWDAFDRTNTDDAAAFDDGSIPTLGWTATSHVTFPVADPYVATFNGNLRRVAPTAGSTHGPLLLARTWLASPATFGSGSNSYFKQDYEIEIFWEESPGRIFHAYGMWRQVKIGSIPLTLDDNGFANKVLDNLVAWDSKTEMLCEKM